MHTVLLILNCQPGKRDALLEGLAASLPDTRAFDGCKLVETYVDNDNPDRAFLWEKWESRGHQEKYMQWRVESGSMDAMADIFSGPPEIIHLGANPA
jgi:quinol monooxygenase YgiN